MKTTRRNVLKAGLAAGLTFPFLSDFSIAKTLPTPTWQKLPAWRGFNLLEKFMNPWNNGPFRESDFQMISELGFNFVRLPMDYRNWIIDKDWRTFDEKSLKEIDQAVQYGEKYGIHVNINFHRAPGYTVAQPPESPAIWDDAETQEVCALHWATFAKRYKQFSNEQVSFNLFNEPTSVDPVKYLAVHKKIIDAIRSESPDRLIICDGTEYGAKPFLPLVDLKVAQSTRGYAPSEISHYKASWVNSESFPDPTWPMVSINGLLPAPTKRELPEESRKPLTIEGPFPGKTMLRLHVVTVSGKSKFAVQADGKTIFERQFDPGPGEGEWEKSVFMPQWNTYQNIYNIGFGVPVPAGTKVVTVQTVEGDWILLSELGIARAEGPVEESIIQATAGWGQKSDTLKYKEVQVTSGNCPTYLGTVTGGTVKDRDWLKRTMIEPWQELEKAGAGVMVGEFGSFNHTPHDVVLRWLGDSIANWNEAGWGYAMWNFRGSFGILDSERTDVEYEDFHGHKLDRKLLELMRG
ncbi:MAG: glycoside hydrolase family 5 protein [Planctomycetaceae bacterium]|nr:glycoside hydrolase family 5 protein [Planctomycetaceae bacterium]